MAGSAGHHGRLRELAEELHALSAERDALEGAWLEASESIEQLPRRDVASPRPRSRPRTAPMTTL